MRPAGRRDTFAVTVIVRDEELGVDRRVNKGGGPIIVDGNSAGNILRDSEIAVDSSGRVAVPSRHPRQHRAQRRIAETADAIRAEV